MIEREKKHLILMASLISTEFFFYSFFPIYLFVCLFKLTINEKENKNKIEKKIKNPKNIFEN